MIMTPVVYAVARSSTIEQDDLRLIQGLAIHPRVPFAFLAEVVGISEQTVARRYRRLLAAGWVRVIGMPAGAAAPASRWMVRLRCGPGVVDDVAAALARRTDVSWVTITAGGSEIVCNLLCATMEDRELMLLKRLPRARSINRVSPAECLHVFRPERGADWQAYGRVLSDEQTSRLDADRRRRSAGSEPSSNMSIGEDDAPLLSVIAADGRATIADLAVPGHQVGSSRLVGDWPSRAV